MLREKKKLLRHRLISFFLLLINNLLILLLIKLSLYDSNEGLNSSNKLFAMILLPIAIISLIFVFACFIASLCLSYKVYRYRNKKIIVYAGWYHHYITVNGQYMDEHNTLMSFTPIVMSCTLNDGTNIQTSISLSNRISLKINNKLATSERT